MKPAQWRHANLKQGRQEEQEATPKIAHLSCTCLLICRWA